MEGNLKIKKEILEVLSEYIVNNSNQRFGQILFNLNINQFKISGDNAGSDGYQLRDIYNDEDSEILCRLKDRIKLLNQQL